MNINNILKYSLGALLTVAMPATAQVQLQDKSAQKVDLGFGVEQSELLQRLPLQPSQQKSCNRHLLSAWQMRFMANC